jgi:hypothetical protein
MPDPALKPAAPVIRSHRLNYAPPLTAVERLFRYLPARDSLVGFLKTLVWVAPLTLLIWVYAEREQNVKQEGVIVPIEVRTSDPNRIVTLRLPADKNVVLELYGPRAKVDHIRDLLKPNPKDGAPLVIDIDSQIAAGENKQTTTSLINNNPVFKSNGITVKSAQPPYLVVDIDTYEERDAIVKVPPEVAKLLSEPAHISPEIVKVRAPKSLFDSQPKDEPLFVYADLANRDELKTPGKPKVTFESVPVYWGSHRENVHITPATVAADLLLKASNQEYIIPSVTIYKKSPADFDKDYIVNYSPTISNVHVTGPSDQIELLKKDPKKCEAVLFVDNFNKDQGQGILKFELPPGVTVTAPVSFPYTTIRREK